MLLNFSELARRRAAADDVFIVGSGPAAIATAYALEQHGVASTLLESGEPGKTEQWDIKTEGFLPADYGVAETYPQLRARREPGGGMSLWGGWCTALRETTFARPDLSDYPGWPITKTDLVPFYSRAGDLLKIAEFDKTMPDAVPIADSGLTAKVFRFSPPVRYADFASHIAESNKITLVTGATVVGLQGSNGRVTGIAVQNGTGVTTVPCRKSIVLAGGVVGNARILSRSPAVGVTANAQKGIGKYLFEHPHCYSLAKVVFAPQTQALIANKAYWSDQFLSLTPTADFLTQQKITDFNFTLWPLADNALDARDTAIAKNYELIHGTKAQFYNATLGMEQATHNAASSVLDSDTLARKNDGHLTLDLSAQKTVIEVARKWLTSHGLHAWVAPQKTPPIVAVGHMHGTTRMAVDDTHGVADADCRVFGTKNLFAAGSSVFPTAGFTNPTVTIAALAMRLVDHIAKEAA